MWPNIQLVDITPEGQGNAELAEAHRLRIPTFTTAARSQITSIEVAPIVKTSFADNKCGTGRSDFLGAAGAAPTIPAPESALGRFPALPYPPLR